MKKSIIFICATVVSYLFIQLSSVYDFSPYDKTVIVEDIPLNLDTLYNSPHLLRPSFDARNKKCVIAFLSLSCNHCKIAAYKLSKFKKHHPDLPIYFIANGTVDKVKVFLEKSNTVLMPFYLLKQPHFLNLSHTTQLPAVYLVDSNKIVQELRYVHLTESQLHSLN